MARNFPGGRARLWRALAPAALVLLAVAVPSAGFAVGDVRDTHHESTNDFDLRTGKAAPTAAQRAAVQRLRASATWTKFGTPSTLIRHRGSLGRVRGTDRVAARRWLAAHRGLFRLESLAGLAQARSHLSAGRAARSLSVSGPALRRCSTAGS